MGIFAFKSAKVEVYFQLECAPEQLISAVIANSQAFLCCHVFPVVSELDHLLLEHVVISGDLDVAFGKCYTRGALNRLLGVFDIDWNQGSTNNEISSGVDIFMRWVFNFCLFYLFFLRF